MAEGAVVVVAAVKVIDLAEADAVVVVAVMVLRCRWYSGGLAVVKI